jgi:hypothetical protein
VDPQAGRANEPLASSSLAGLFGSCALIAAALVPFAVGVGGFAWSFSGATGLAATGIAFLVCWFSASLALAIAWLGMTIKQPLPAVLGGMMVRMGLPLGTGVLLQKLSPALAEARVLTIILGLYLVALLVETLLSLRYVQQGFAGTAAVSPLATTKSAESAGAATPL